MVMFKLGKRCFKDEGGTIWVQISEWNTASDLRFIEKQVEKYGDEVKWIKDKRGLWAIYRKLDSIQYEDGILPKMILKDINHAKSGGNCGLEKQKTNKRV